MEGKKRKDVKDLFYASFFLKIFFPSAFFSGSLLPLIDAFYSWWISPSSNFLLFLPLFLCIIIFFFWMNVGTDSKDREAGEHRYTYPPTEKNRKRQINTAFFWVFLIIFSFALLRCWFPCFECRFDGGAEEVKRGKVRRITSQQQLQRLTPRDRGGRTPIPLHCYTLKKKK